MKTAAADFTVYARAVRRLKKDKRSGGWIFAVHWFPHLDEIVALFVIVRFWAMSKMGRLRGYSAKLNRVDAPLAVRREFWMGIVQNVEFWTGGGVTPDSRPWQYHVRLGKFLLGCAHGSPFDEHASDGFGAMLRQCCATLAALFMGVRKHPALTAILAETLRNDTRGSVSNMELGELIKLQFKALGYNATAEEQRSIIVDALCLLDVLFANRRNGFGDVIKKCEASATAIRREVNFRGQDVLILADRSDHPNFMAAARAFKSVGRHNIIIQQFSTGHINIMVSQNLFALDAGKADQVLVSALAELKIQDLELAENLRVYLRKIACDPERKALVDEAVQEVIARLRIWEARNEWRAVPKRLLKAEGSIPQARHWYYYKPMAAIFNRSLTAPDTPVTALSLEQVVDIVENAFTKP